MRPFTPTRRILVPASACLLLGGLGLAACSGDDPAPPSDPPASGSSAAPPSSGPDPTTTPTDAGPVEVALPDGLDPVSRVHFSVQSDGTDLTTSEALDVLEEGPEYRVVVACSGDPGTQVSYRAVSAEVDLDEDEREESEVSGRASCGVLQQDTYQPAGAPVPEVVEISFTSLDDGVSEATAVVVAADPPGPGDASSPDD